MRRDRVIALVAGGGAALGIAAELVSHASTARAAADLATGWTLLGSGLWGWRARPSEWRWPLLAGAGLLWFAGNFADAGWSAVASTGAALIYLHRGLVVHATASGRLRRSPTLVAIVVLAYVDGLVTGGPDAELTLALGVLVGAVGVASLARRGGPPVLVAASQLVLGAGLVLAGATSLADVSSQVAGGALDGYEAALAATALLLAGVPASEARTRAMLTDLVVELGPSPRSRTVRDALSRALGDPSLQVGYWLADSQRYVDFAGRPVAVPPREPDRVATILERDGQRLAALVHDASVLDDPSLAGAVQEAAGLVVANARLEAEVSAQLGELRASRQRIVEARDDQRRRLAWRLHEGAERRLEEVARALARAREQAAPGGEDAQLFDLIEDEIAQASAELADLARGIHPRVLTEQGLGAALEALAERAPVPVDVVGRIDRLPAPTEAAAYFLCSEALANVAKYARASRVRCEVDGRDGRLLIEVADDGAGGADPGRGSGLRGLADRIDALGGSFEVLSPAGAGTIVRAELPLPDREAAVNQGPP
jgi:signal transduction histidine kinase